MQAAKPEDGAKVSPPPTIFLSAPPLEPLSSYISTRSLPSRLSPGSTPTKAKISTSTRRASSERTSNRFLARVAADKPLRRYEKYPLSFPLKILVLCRFKPEFEQFMANLLCSENVQEIQHEHPSALQRWRVFQWGRLELSVGNLASCNTIDTAVRVTQFLMRCSARFVTFIGVCSGMVEHELGQVFLVTKAYFPQIPYSEKDVPIFRKSAEFARSAPPEVGATSESPCSWSSTTARISFSTPVTEAVQRIRPQSQIEARQLPLTFEATDQAVRNAAEFFCLTAEAEAFRCEASEVITTTTHRKDVVADNADMAIDADAYAFLHAAASLEIPTLPLFLGVAEFSSVDCSPFKDGVAARAANACYEFIKFVDSRDMWTDL